MKLKFFAREWRIWGLVFEPNIQEPVMESDFISLNILQKRCLRDNSEHFDWIEKPICFLFNMNDFWERR
jgi:hypothetical protein